MFSTVTGMSAAIVVKRDATVVVLDGEIDVANVGPLIDALASIAARPTEVVVDLDGVRFFGACGINALIGARAALQESGSTLQVVGAIPLIRRVFHLLDLADLLVASA